MRLLLVASSGGHLAQLHWLRPWWSAHDRLWVTFDTPDARGRLEGERVVWAHHPTNRDVSNLLRNLRLARRVVAEERPDVVLSNGAGVAVPFLLAGRRAGALTLFQEVYDRVERPSLTGRLVAPWVDAVLLARPAQRRAHPRGLLLGELR